MSWLCNGFAGIPIDPLKEYLCKNKCVIDRTQKFISFISQNSEIHLLTPNFSIRYNIAFNIINII